MLWPTASNPFHASCPRAKPRASTTNVQFTRGICISQQQQNRGATVIITFQTQKGAIFILNFASASYNQIPMRFSGKHIISLNLVIKEIRNFSHMSLAKLYQFFLSHNSTCSLHYPIGVLYLFFICTQVTIFGYMYSIIFK